MKRKSTLFFFLVACVLFASSAIHFSSETPSTKNETESATSSGSSITQQASQAGEVDVKVTAGLNRRSSRRLGPNAPPRGNANIATDGESEMDNFNKSEEFQTTGNGNATPTPTPTTTFSSSPSSNLNIENSQLEVTSNSTITASNTSTKRRGSSGASGSGERVVGAPTTPLPPSSAQLRQLNFLLEENRRLKSEVSTLQRTIEEGTGIDTQLQIEQFQARAAEDTRRTAELQDETSRRNEVIARTELATATQVRLAAEANQTSTQEALRLAEIALESARLETTRAEAERIRLQVEVQIAREATRQAEAERDEATAANEMWTSIRETSEANASSLQASTTLALTELQTAEEKRRTIELELSAAEFERLAVEVRTALQGTKGEIDSAVQGRVEAEIRTVTLEAERWEAEYRRLQGEIEANATQEVMNVTSEIITNLQEALVQAQEMFTTSVKATNEVFTNASLAEALTVKRLGLELQIATLQSQSQATQLETVKQELERARQVRNLTLAVAEQMSHNATLVRQQTFLAQLEVQNLTLVTEAGRLKLRLAEAEVIRTRLVAESVQGKKDEAVARVEELRRQEGLASQERLRMQAVASEASAHAVVLQANATAESMRAIAARGNEEAARLLFQSRQLEALAANETARALQLRVEEATTQLKTWHERRLLAEAALSTAQTSIALAEEHTAQLELQSSIAAHNSTRAFNDRLTSETNAYSANLVLQTETERLLLEEARANTASLERLRLEAETTVLRARAEYDRTQGVVQMEQMYRRLLNAEDELARAREMTRLQGEMNLSLLAEEARFSNELRLITARGAADHEARLDTVRIETEGKIREARENEDVHARHAAAAAEAERTRLIESTAMILSGIGQGLKSMLTEYLDKVVLGIGAIAAAIFASREGFTLLRQELSRILGQPSLVRETSRKQGLGVVLLSILNTCTFGLSEWLIRSIKNAFAVSSDSSDGKSSNKSSSSNDPFEDVIMAPELDIHIKSFAYSTANSHAHAAPLRSAMFFGPPGTGKTMVAQRLARHCGLDYAMMSGGDVAPLGSSAVSELNKLFAWANASSRGLLLFIDEAEAFLASRSRTNMSEDMRNVLSALLHHTGDANGNAKLMLVIATNRPGDLDSAVSDRMDESMFFGSPREEERVKLGRLYFHKYIGSRSQYAQLSTANIPFLSTSAAAAAAAASARNGQGMVVVSSTLRSIYDTLFVGRKKVTPPPIRIESDVTLALLDSISRQADGFSGRQIAKLMLNIQASVYASPSLSTPKGVAGGGTITSPTTTTGCVLTSKMMLSAFKAELEKHGRRLAGSGGGGSEGEEMMTSTGTTITSQQAQANALWAGVPSPDIIRRGMMMKQNNQNPFSSLLPPASSQKGEKGGGGGGGGGEDHDNDERDEVAAASRGSEPHEPTTTMATTNASNAKNNKSNNNNNRRKSGKNGNPAIVKNSGAAAGTGEAGRADDESDE